MQFSGAEEKPFTDLGEESEMKSETRESVCERGEVGR
jgi:hypothetical protein